jgi:hypothetical protein
MLSFSQRIEAVSQGSEIPIPVTRLSREVPLNSSARFAVTERSKTTFTPSKNPTSNIQNHPPPQHSFAATKPVSQAPCIVAA